MPDRLWLHRDATIEFLSLDHILLDGSGSCEPFMPSIHHLMYSSTLQNASRTKKTLRLSEGACFFTYGG
jgi:hypothetical protein